MNIAIFESVTTEGVLLELEAEGKKYDGLYVDMENAPERKYVKDKAAEIKGLLKKVDAHRIADKKAYGVKVEAQAAAIVTRLTDANSNFQVLIDAYTLQRKKILDDEKEVVRLRAAMVQKEDDHEMGLLINKTYEFDKDEELRLAKEESDRIEKEALEKAVNRMAALGEKQAQDKINAENARLANKEHCTKINNDVLNALVERFNFNHTIAKELVVFIAKNNVPHTTINY